MAWENVNNRKQNRRDWGDEPQVIITKTGFLVNEAFVILYDVKTHINVVMDQQNKRLGFFLPRHDTDRENSYRVCDESKNIRRVNSGRVAEVFKEYRERPYTAVYNPSTRFIEVDLIHGQSST